MGQFIMRSLALACFGSAMYALGREHAVEEIDGLVFFNDPARVVLDESESSLCKKYRRKMKFLNRELRPGAAEVPNERSFDKHNLFTSIASDLYRDRLANLLSHLQLRNVLPKYEEPAEKVEPAKAEPEHKGATYGTW